MVLVSNRVQAFLWLSTGRHLCLRARRRVCEDGQERQPPARPTLAEVSRPVPGVASHQDQ
ncbi:hypothetical protein LC607_35605 [Nostoc sp. CHAB 5824]|nr:hypothetical protein [Nostoc sp. CHAB 5824]